MFAFFFSICFLNVRVSTGMCVAMCQGMGNFCMLENIENNTLGQVKKNDFMVVFNIFSPEQNHF